MIRTRPQRFPLGPTPSWQNRMDEKKITYSILFFIIGLIVPIISIGYPGSYKTSAEERNNNEFINFVSQKKKLPQANEEVSLIAVGDISYSRAVERIVKKQGDINYPFQKIQDYLKNADFVFGNLETPITPGREISDYEMVFRSNPGTEQALGQAGFSILSLANNHTPNFGDQGLKDTFKYLDMAGIKYVGAGINKQEANQPIYKEINGIKFAFLAFNDPDVVPASYEASDVRAGTAFMRNREMAETVKKAKQTADYVIVSMHSGIEYSATPNGSQTDFAHAAIDAGADLIIGHHPHVVQTMEQYKGKYIFYSLGNFVFDQPQFQTTKEGMLIKIFFTKMGISRINLLPVVMENLAQPKIAEAPGANTILQRLDYPLQTEAVYFWDGNGNKFEKTLIATIYNNLEANNAIDLKRRQIGQNSYQLENGRLTITNNTELIWQSPTDWWVDSFILADSNNDGIIDINLSVWKPGNFGLSKPFWVEKNDMSVKNHFFIFDLVDGLMKPIWQSSNLTAPNCEFTIIDVDNDGKNDLVVLEGNYLQKPNCKGEYVAIWKWNGWGFSNEWRSEQGHFFNLKTTSMFSQAAHCP